MCRDMAVLVLPAIYRPPSVSLRARAQKGEVVVGPCSPACLGLGSWVERARRAGAVLAVPAIYYLVGAPP